MFKNFVKISTIIVAVFSAPTAFAGEIGVSHSVSNSVRSGIGKLTVESIKNIEIAEKSISFTGQLSGAEFQYGEGAFSGSGFGMVDGPDKDKGKGNDKTGPSLSIGGVLGSGGVEQLSASIATRQLTSTESINTKLIENYTFSDSVFTQTSSTFSR